MLEAAKTQFKDTAPFNSNVNDGKMLGVGLLPGTIGGGIRNSSANYLVGETKTNLDLLTEGTVTKVLFAEGAVPKATGVEYSTGPGSKSKSRCASPRGVSWRNVPDNFRFCALV